MQVSSQEIVFKSPMHCREFLSELRLMGQVRFSRAIASHSGSVMIRERIFVQQSLLERLTDSAETLECEVGVEVSEELLVRVRGELIARVLTHFERPQNAFLRRLLSNLHRSPRSCILNAFHGRPLALFAIHLARENPSRFDRLTTIGLLNLAILLQQDRNHPLIHRHAFLAGFFSLAGFADTPGTIYPEAFADREDPGACSVDRFGLPAGLELVFHGLQGQPMTLPDVRFAGAGAERPAGESDESGESVHPESIPVLTECLRIALCAGNFLHEMRSGPRELRLLVQRLAQLAAARRLNRQLTGAVLRRFGEYRTVI